METPRVDGKIQACKTKWDIEEVLAETLAKRFCLVRLSPLCQGMLFYLPGFHTDTKAELEMLEGTFFTPFPPDTSLATQLILAEIAWIWQKMKDG